MTFRWRKSLRLISPTIVLFYFLHFINLQLMCPQRDHLKETNELVITKLRQTADSIGQSKERMVERLAKVKNSCLQHLTRPAWSSSKKVEFADLSSHPLIPKNSVFFFNQKKKWAYCPIYKAASTSFLYWLLRVEGGVADPKISLIDSARKYYPKVDSFLDGQKLLRDSFKWMVVRHPFERILSAYRDKMENSTAEPFYYTRYGLVMIMKYRLMRVTGPKEPTFEEFVRYLIDANMQFTDEHWTPYYVYCAPCLVDYDLILHFETLEQDVQLLIHFLNNKLQQRNANHSLIDAHLEWKHKTLSVAGRKSAERNLRSYYSQLDKTTVRKLHEKYRLDFELFGYGNANEFIAMAREG